MARLAVMFREVVPPGVGGRLAARVRSIASAQMERLEAVREADLGRQMVPVASWPAPRDQPR
jgi:hypothetical protein